MALVPMLCITVPNVYDGNCGAEIVDVPAALFASSQMPIHSGFYAAWPPRGTTVDVEPRDEMQLSQFANLNVERLFRAQYQGIGSWTRFDGMIHG
jgi:hypothetical protein